MDKKRLKNIIYPFVLLAAVFIVYKYRQSKTTVEKENQMVQISGTTMGTIGYNISYMHPDMLDLSEEIDSLLKVWNQSMSTYINDSEISRFNSDSCFSFESQYFYPVLEKSKEVYENTNGAFDPTVAPLVNAWGFGPEENANPDSTMIDSLMQYVGFDKIFFDKNKVCKKVKGVELDFSAIAKGYAVDVVADFIKSKGITDLMVEIGGELICFGKNDEGNDWRMGIEDPRVHIDEQKLFAIASISGLAIATSGNYRNYYVKDSVVYSHTMDPKTGYSVHRNILSASVFADDCMTADAYATAFMVSGVERSKEILAEQDELEAFLIYTTEEGELDYYVTEGIRAKIEVLHEQ